MSSGEKRSRQAGWQAGKLAGKQASRQARGGEAAGPDPATHRRRGGPHVEATASRNNPS